MSELFPSNLIYLRQKTGKTQIETAAVLGISRSTYVNYEIGENVPKLDIIVKIIGHFGVTFETLVFEDLQNVHLNDINSKKEGASVVHLNVLPTVHLKPDNDELGNGKEVYHLTPQVITVDSKGNDNMVLVPVRARAGYLEGFGDAEFISSLPAYRIPGFTNGVFRMFEVDGFSMHNTLHDKDLIATKFVENLDHVRDERVYVIVTKRDGVVIKRVLNRIKTDNKLILKSDAIKDKEQYPTMVLDASDVLEIWDVKAKLTRHLPSPSDLYNRVSQMEGDMALLRQNLLSLQAQSK